MEVFYEKREYETGTHYLPVEQIVPGQIYYAQMVDTYGQTYYVEKNPSATSGPQYPTSGPQFTGSGPQYTTSGPQFAPSGPQYTVSPGPSVVDNPAYDEMNGLHLGITITSIFIPTLIFLIGFPFCHVKMKRLVGELGNPPSLVPRLHAYMGVGWTSWVMHLGVLASACTAWIPDDCYYSCFYPAIPAVGAFFMLSVIFTIVVTVLGANLVYELKVFASSGGTSQSPLLSAQQKMYSTY